jgi:ferredoxin
VPYTAAVDKDVCISSGRCVADAPTAFRFDDEELAEPTPAFPPLPDDELLAVARACPSGAVSLSDEHGAPVDVG